VNRPAKTAFAGGGYIGTILAANWITAHLGPIWVAPGMVTAAGTYAAGLALLARDGLQEAAGRRAVLAAIGAGTALSAWLAGGQLAFASAVAFLLSEGLDMAVYSKLRWSGWAKAALASNIVGAVPDTLVFLWLVSPQALHLPPGMSEWSLAPGQLVGKIVWATLLPVAVISAWRRARASKPAAVTA
jgi:hypothetical protein